MPFLFTRPGLRGIGDALFLTVVAREFKRRSPLSLIGIKNANHEIFFHNPDVDVVVCSDEANIRGPLFLQRKGSRIPQIVGSRWLISWLASESGLFGKSYNAHHGWPPSMPLLQETAEACGLHLCNDEAKTLRPFFWPLSQELDQFAGFRGVVCVQSTAATYFTVNKQWPVDRIQTVVDQLRRTMRIVQVGSKDDVALKGVEDYRGKTTIRQTAALLAHARLFVGMEGGLMHLARAVDTRSVIVYTKFITPQFSGYDVNVNVCKVDQPETPCWRLSRCECDCAKRVSVEDVLCAIDAALALPPLTKHYEASE